MSAHEAYDEMRITTDTRTWRAEDWYVAGFNAGAIRKPGMRHTDACLMHAAKGPPGEPVCIAECADLRRASRVA